MKILLNFIFYIFFAMIAIGTCAQDTLHIIIVVENIIIIIYYYYKF